MAEKKAAKVAATEENRLMASYKSSVVPALKEHFKYENINQVPKLVKIVINAGLGDVKDKAKKSVANFKVREGMPIGAKVTLRNRRMYEFMDKLVSIALPRVRDFHGVNANAFDGRGNYTLGIKEQLIFPEIQYDQVEKTRGFDITFVTTANTDEEARELLRLLGMPFAK